MSVSWVGSDVSPQDRGGRAIAVAPAHAFTYRKVRLPAANARTRRRIVSEELSFSLPFPLSQCVWDYYLQPGPEAFAVVAQQSRWEGLSARWGNVSGADPEPLCYLRAALHAGVHDALIIDFGASHTTWMALSGGKIEWVRTMMRGGQVLSQVISDDSKSSLTDAEDAKRRSGTELPVVKAFLSELLDETMLPLPLTYSQVLLCGGGANLPGLRQFLHARLGVEPKPFPVPPLLSPYQHVSAFGAALSGKPGMSRLRLLAGEAGPPPSVALTRWLGVGAAASVLWVSSLELRHGALIQQRDQLRNDFRPAAAVLGVALPPSLKTPEEADKWLSDQQRFRLKVKTSSVGFVADSLARAAQALREVGDCQLNSFTFDDGKVQLEGDAGNQVKAQALRQKWLQVYPDLKQTSLRKGQGEGFHFVFEGKMPQV